MMRWMRVSSLEQFTPIGLIATGILIGASSPVIKKSIRGLAVMTAKGILTVSDNLKESGERLTNSWTNLVTEAREQRETNFNLKDHLHVAGVTAVRSGLNVADEVQGMVNNAKEKINIYVEEARRELEKSIAQTTQEQAAKNESESVCHCTSSEKDNDNYELKANVDLYSDEHEYDEGENYKN